MLTKSRGFQEIHTQKKKSEAVTYEHDRKISKERYISPEERLEIIN